MIITFSSKAGPDIVMFGDVAKRLLQAIGKEPADSGIITVEQIAQVVDCLQAVIAADKAARAGKMPEEFPAFERAGDGNMRPYVHLANRALPLLDLCQRALRRSAVVQWGHRDPLTGIFET